MNRNFERKLNAFKNNILAKYSLLIYLLFILLSFFASFWINDRPYVLSYKGNYYFPLFIKYSAKDFNIKNTIEVDYKNLKDTDWSIWPLVKWSPNESNKKVEYYPSPPSMDNFLGTDNRGRDVFTRLVYGLRYSVIYSFSVWILTTFLSVLVGGIMGLYGGGIDFVGQRIVEILSSVPQFFLLLIIVSIYGPSLFGLILITCLFGWISMSYYVRGEFLKLRKREFVEAARSLGASKMSIIFKHILPNAMIPILTFAPFQIASYVVYLASLDYLGMGLRPPTPSWGELLNQAKEHFTTAWWLALFPSLALFIKLVLLAFIGDGVREALDPYKRK